MLDLCTPLGIVCAPTGRHPGAMIWPWICPDRWGAGGPPASACAGEG